MLRNHLLYGGCVIRCSEELAVYLRADLTARGLGPGWQAEYRGSQPVAYYQRLLRYAEYFTNCRRDALGLAWALLVRRRLLQVGRQLGLQVALNTFGPGLVLSAEGPITVQAPTRGGRYCVVEDNVAILGADGRAPRIGDEVTIGSRSLVSGNVAIRNGSTIAPGSRITEVAPAR
jgi:serine O-acetyltransferase